MNYRGTIVASGLVALDLYYHRRGCFWNVGGTVANVLSVLAKLGHHTIPVGTIGNDAAGSAVIRKLGESGVSTDCIDLQSYVSTPFVACESVQNESRFGSKHAHRWWCWRCEKRYPRFIEPSEESFRCSVLSEIKPDLILVDRISQAALHYAKMAKRKGAKIYLEPAYTSKTDLMEEFVAVADIIKYSREAPVSEQFPPIPNHVTVIETMGSAGIRWSHEGEEQWCASVKIDEPVDTSGAGDWCTAGIIHQIVNSAPGSDARLTQELLSEAIAKGSYFGAFACTFLGTTSVLPAALKSGTFFSRPSWQDHRDLLDIGNSLEENLGPILHCLNCGAPTSTTNSWPWKS